MEFMDDSIDFAAYLKETDHKTFVRPAREFVEDAKERLRRNSTERKVYLPWTKCNESFHFRKGEVSMWCGQNGHGKTDLTTQIALSLLGQGEKVCIASFEMKPVVTVNRMVRMFAGTNPFSPEYQSQDGIEALDALYDDFKGWSVGLWLYTQTGTANPVTVAGMVKYCAQELGCSHVFIDSLMKCVKDEDDMNGQKSFVDTMCAMAKDCDIHIHLVHHLRKPSKEGDMPDKHDTKGSGSITDQIDNLFMVWRNKPKEDDIRTNGFAAKKKEEPDCILLCRKQRNYEGSDDGEPQIGLWRHKDAGQFVGQSGDSPLFFPNYPHYPS